MEDNKLSNQLNLTFDRIEISLENIKIPSTISTKESDKIFIYIPNFTSITLSEGKNFENGFWSIFLHNLHNTKILAPSGTKNFQILFIYKDINDNEILCNIYYDNDKLISGPFITATYTMISPNIINLRIKSFSNPSNTIFEIQGLPNVININKGNKNYIDDLPIWEMNKNDASNITIDIPNKNTDKNSPLPLYQKLNLSITAKDKSAPHYKTTFTIIIDLRDKHISPQNQYREIKINTFDILKKTQIPFDNYILSIKDLPEYCCIPNAIKISNKWIINKHHNHQITINNFRKTEQEFYITLGYIILNKHQIIPTIDNTYTTKIKCDFTKLPLITKDYTKCITCRNYDRCKLFKNFMEYIGNSTIIRHILK